MSSVEAVVGKFGGQTALATLLGKRQSTVGHWVKSGVIPSKWHRQLMGLAREQGIDLRPEHLVPMGDAYAEGAKEAQTPQEVVSEPLATQGDAEVSRPAALSESELEAVLETTEETSPHILGQLPEAQYRGYLSVGRVEIPCYVLDNGQRVIGRTSLTEWLSGIKGGGGLEKYLGVASLRSFIPLEGVVDRMVSFRLPEVERLSRSVKGLPADLVIDICKGFMSALEASTWDESVEMTPRQVEMSIKAGMFVAACAKSGLDALIDEATGYQYERAEDALQVKLRAYLEEEMRQWEKTFPDELWKEFGRLTNWKGSVTQRPKYWGKLVNELIYNYLDPDVAKWLKENAPKPRHGQNYHQWLSSQYGLKKLVEHLWMVIGMSSACHSMPELKRKMGEKYGRIPIQYTLFVEPPGNRKQLGP